MWAFRDIPGDPAFVPDPDDRVWGWHVRLHYNKIQRLRGPLRAGREPLGYINGEALDGL